MPIADPRTARLAACFETLTRDNLDAALDLYAEDACFKDPFNEVRGRAAIRAIFVHMFDALSEPRFTIVDTVTQDDQAFLTWHFSCGRGGSPTRLTIRGATQLRYDGHGRVTLHRDYWDAAEELYAQLPLLGPLMRWLQRRLRTPQR